jgi:hypothetical protein
MIPAASNPKAITILSIKDMPSHADGWILSEKIATSISSSRSGGFSGAAVKAPLHSEDPVQEAAMKRTIEDLELVNEVMPHRHLIMRKRRRKYYK